MDRRIGNLLNQITGHQRLDTFPLIPRYTSSMYPQGILQGHVAIITGSGQGIGEATAHLFAAEGAKVIVNDLDLVKSDTVAANIREKGGDCISYPGDVTKEGFAEGIVGAAVEAFGTVTILVNNAGYTWDGMLHKMTDKQWSAMLDVHNTAAFRLIRALAPIMREEAKAEMENGSAPSDRVIINVSSTSGLHGNVGQANYATAKLGINGLTKTVAKEWGPLGIRCNSVAFAGITTRLTQVRTDDSKMVVQGEEVKLGIPESLYPSASSVPLSKRPGTPEEAAGAILMMASPYSSYITGHCLECTGGVGI
eukprot:TRINITY_DN11866_c0_g1_i1.p1 TRINITY_DN11866_c0_g1~~TRINITY_DN11866_c0_g1_i1.p1  ORF type:complete len:309 (+),score=71.53 TRINITY_DN11866_c0_g1_i1:8-934(+)